MSVYTFDLTNIGDLYEVDRVICLTPTGEYINDCPFKVEGNSLILPGYVATNCYKVAYRPKISRLLSADTEAETTDKWDQDLAELGVPEDIAQIIPYYIKGDLFQADEPNLASEARNWYEQSCAQIKQRQTQKEHKVSNHFGIF